MHLWIVCFVLLCTCIGLAISSYRFSKLRKKMNELATKGNSDFKLPILRGMDERFPFSEKTLSRMFDKYYIYITDQYAMATLKSYLVSNYRKSTLEEFVFDTFYDFIKLYIEGKINSYSGKELFKYEGRETETKEYGDIEYSIYSLTAKGKEIYSLYFTLAKLIGRDDISCSYIEEILLSGKKKEHYNHAGTYY